VASINRTEVIKNKFIAHEFIRKAICFQVTGIMDLPFFVGLHNKAAATWTIYIIALNSDWYTFYQRGK